MHIHARISDAVEKRKSLPDAKALVVGLAQFCDLSVLAAARLREPGCRAEAIGDDASLLQALLRLIQTGASELRVERDGQRIGRITLSSIYAGLQAGREQPLTRTAAQ